MGKTPKTAICFTLCLVYMLLGLWPLIWAVDLPFPTGVPLGMVIIVPWFGSVAGVVFFGGKLFWAAYKALGLDENG